MIATAPPRETRMPDEMPEVARRQTWIDWVPPEGREDALLDAEPLLTRDELVAELNQGGDVVNARNLVHWQAVGAIPYPVTKRRQGAPRALYPQWMITTIHLLKSLQEQGYKLREIGPLLRGDTYHRFTSYPKTPRQQRDHDRRVAKRALPPLMEELDPRLRSLARVHEHLDGGRVTHAEIHLVDDQGKKVRRIRFLVGDAGNAPDESEVDIVKNE
jgi:DNA-binding transcriptional MerR regulator